MQIDHQQYLTPAAFLADAHLIVRCAEELYGEPEVAAAALVQQAAAAPAAGNTAAAAGATEGGGAANPAAGQAAAADDKAAAGAAAGSLPVLTRSLPAVRVAVCKEISRAMELKVSQQGTSRQQGWVGSAHLSEPADIQETPDDAQRRCNIQSWGLLPEQINIFMSLQAPRFAHITKQPACTDFLPCCFCAPIPEEQAQTDILNDMWATPGLDSACRPIPKANDLAQLVHRQCLVWTQPAVCPAINGCFRVITG